MSNTIKKNTDDALQEKKLVQALKQGDEAAFRTLMETHREHVYSVAFGFTLDREESLDIVQDVFIKAFRSMDSFKAEAKLSTWLHRIAVNECLNWKRKWARRFRRFHQPLDRPDGTVDPELKSREKGPEELLVTKEMGSRLKKAMQSLPKQAKMVFVLKEIDGRSYEEIARILKIKKGTVSSRLHYARKKLQEYLTLFLDEEKP